MLSRLRSRKSEGFVEPSTPGDPGAETLAFLLAQGLPTTPRYYALAHASLADRSSIEAHSVAEAMHATGRLSLEAAEAILARISPAPPAAAELQAAEEHERLRHQTLHLADLAATATAATNQFGRDLSAGLSDLESDGRSVLALVSSMVERTRSTEQQLAAAVQQIEQLRDEVAEARNDAMRDELTGLLNRRGILDHLAGLGGHAVRTLAICDIDKFKAINDGHGHEVGDRVLKVVAAALAQGCAPHLVGRWGGEEFIVLLDEPDPARAAEIVDDVREELSRRTLRVRETGKSLGTVTFSAGLSAFAGAPLDPALRIADALLYQAKLSGRNKVLIELPPAARAA
ncbi:GGDEF domain-containing protein [Sphingomonas sp. G-3-2-10]|uniref:GGDEF domain-containing protein n=1 Tax=Sphingomonas sp. G-3-2-10 TaxID=2728838 RepID=UPI00146B07FF|nr:GGDEF domain-containing protein [Sphingomonas sp. G-3-2-10]NML06177.1 GGDEF domain-containing protein [Sphingomonas sp. G-3-2-10]